MRWGTGCPAARAVGARAGLARAGAGTDALVKGCAVILLALLVLPVAAGSTGIGAGGGPFALRVDARGYAEAAWAGHTVLVPPTGSVLPGRRLSTRDVSRATRAPIPFAKAVRRTPDGRLWALQSWAVLPGRPAEVRFARWRGASPVLTLTIEGGALVGRATFHGKPVPQFSRSFEGRPMRVYVYLDALVSGRWRRIGGVAPRADGTFRRLVPTEHEAAPRFRAILLGPAMGAEIAPDVATIAAR